MAHRSPPDPTEAGGREERSEATDASSGQGPEFDPGWWRSYGRPATILLLGVIGLVVIVVVVLIIVGVLF
jgi:hypothetical protein